MCLKWFSVSDIKVYKLCVEVCVRVCTCEVCVMLCASDDIYIYMYVCIYVCSYLYVNTQQINIAIANTRIYQRMKWMFL